MNLKNIFWSAAMLLLIYFGGKQLFGGGAFGSSTANLVEGLSISTEVKYLVSEHWVVTGTLPCATRDLDFGVTTERVQSVLAAIAVTDCGQITLLYNEDSGMPGHRLVLQADEFDGARGLELTWRCWTPDFPDIDARVRQCSYEDRALAVIDIPDADRDSTDQAVVVSGGAPKRSVGQRSKACRVTPAIYRPVFADDILENSPTNQIVSFSRGREQLIFFTEVIGAAGKQITHKWYLDDAAIADYSFTADSDRWSSWSRIESVSAGTIRVDVYDGPCMIGQASIQSGSEVLAESPRARGWLRPQPALEAVLAKPRIDYADGADRAQFVDDLTDDGDTLLLAAIRGGKSEEALTLINRVTPPEFPSTMSIKEEQAVRGRHLGRADPFLRDANGVSPISLAHKLGHEVIAEALIESAITVHKNVRRRVSKESRFSSRTIKSLLSGDVGFARFDDGDTPLHRAVRTNNERAVLTMLRLPGIQEQTEVYNPAVNLYAHDASGRSAMTIAREAGFYAIERFLSLAMTRKSPGWAVSRSAFATHMDAGEPGDCRQAAFEDEEQMHFFTELSGMHGRRVAHEWVFDRQLVQRTEFKVVGNRWSTHSSKKFSPDEVGTWNVRVVTESGEVLRTERLHYNALTDYNRRNREKMLGVCNVGSAAFSALVAAQAPVSELEYLLGKGTVLKFNSYFGKGLVSRAIIDGNIPVVSWFIERGLDIEDYVDGAATPLLLAVKNDAAAMALFLITRGADVRFKGNRNSQSALHLSISTGKAHLAKILLQHGADPNTIANQGNTPLHGAVQRCSMLMTTLLLEHGADSELKNDKGESPKDIVSQCDSQELWDPQLAELASLYEV